MFSVNKRVELFSYFNNLLEQTGSNIFNARTGFNTREVPFVIARLSNVGEFAFTSLPEKYEKYFKNIEKEFYEVSSLLKSDGSSRRGIISELKNEDSRNESSYPCIIFHHFLVRNDRIHALSFFRSSDLDEKLMDDISYASTLLARMGKELNLPTGELVLILSSVHRNTEKT